MLASVSLTLPVAVFLPLSVGMADPFSLSPLLYLSLSVSLSLCHILYGSFSCEFDGNKIIFSTHFFSTMQTQDLTTGRYGVCLHDHSCASGAAFQFSSTIKAVIWSPAKYVYPGSMTYTIESNT